MSKSSSICTTETVENRRLICQGTMLACVMGNRGCSDLKSTGGSVHLLGRELEHSQSVDTLGCIVLFVATPAVLVNIWKGIGVMYEPGIQVQLPADLRGAQEFHRHVTRALSPETAVALQSVQTC